MIKIERLIDQQELDTQDFIDLYKTLPIVQNNKGEMLVSHFYAIRCLLKVWSPRNNNPELPLPIDEKSWNLRLRGIFHCALVKNKFPLCPFVSIRFFSGDVKITPPKEVLEYEEYLFSQGPRKLYELCRDIEKSNFSHLIDHEISLGYLMGNSFFDKQYRTLILALNNYCKTQDSKMIISACEKVRKRLEEYPFHQKHPYYHQETVEDILTLLENERFIKTGLDK